MDQRKYKSYSACSKIKCTNKFEHQAVERYRDKLKIKAKKKVARWASCLQGYDFVMSARRLTRRDDEKKRHLSDPPEIFAFTT